MDKLNRTLDNNVGLLEEINHHTTSPALKHDLYDFLSLYGNVCINAETYEKKGLFATQ